MLKNIRRCLERWYQFKKMMPHALASTNFVEKSNSNAFIDESLNVDTYIKLLLSQKNLVLGSYLH